MRDTLREREKWITYLATMERPPRVMAWRSEATEASDEGYDEGRRRGMRRRHTARDVDGRVERPEIVDVETS